MTTKIDNLSEQSLETESTIRFISPFMSKMGDPRDYEYRGICIDAGRPCEKCICGHSIRYIFVVHHKTEPREANLGSECINHFQAYNPDLWQALCKAQDKLNLELKEAKRKAKEAKQDIEIDRLRSEYRRIYDILYQAYRSYRGRGIKAPYNLWQAICGWYCGLVNPDNEPEYVRKHSYIKYWNKQIESAKIHAEKCQISINR